MISAEKETMLKDLEANLWETAGDAAALHAESAALTAAARALESRIGVNLKEMLW